VGRIVLPLTGPLGGPVVAPPNGLSVSNPCLGWLAAELRNRERVLGTTMDFRRICGSATRTDNVDGKSLRRVCDYSPQNSDLPPAEL
jgi:hypothetical protein